MIGSAENKDKRVGEMTGKRYINGAAIVKVTLFQGSHTIRVLTDKLHLIL